MYAIIKTGGKQYKVSPGDVIKVEKLEGNIGDTINIGDVLMITADQSVKIGSPIVKGASVIGTITDHLKGDKLFILKKRRRKGLRKKIGHRQKFTQLKIESIKG